VTLDDLTGRLDGLDGEPVVAHPDVLERLHRAIVAELDALAAGTTRPHAAG
jgi:hypothetical protein